MVAFFHWLIGYVPLWLIVGVTVIGVLAVRHRARSTRDR